MLLCFTFSCLFTCETTVIRAQVSFSPFTQSYWNIFLFIYLSFSFKQIDSLLGSEWECWHTFHPVCCLLPLISLTPGFLFQYQSENKFKFVSEWSSVSRFANDFYFRRWFCRILIIGIGRFERNANEINGAQSRLSIF